MKIMIEILRMGKKVCQVCFGRGCEACGNTGMADD